MKTRDMLMVIVTALAGCAAEASVGTGGAPLTAGADPVGRCGSRPQLGSDNFDITSAGDLAQEHQLIQFNPNAAFQRLARTGGFIPNSTEFDWSDGGVTNRSQRFEVLDALRVRVYNVRQVGGAWDWSRVTVEEYDARTYRPAASDSSFRAKLWRQAASHQVISFNPAAALQAEMRLDGYAPNSGEFLTPIDLSSPDSTEVPAQRAERLDSSARFRVYGWVRGRVACYEYAPT
jgi:hypothetical protein